MKHSLIARLSSFVLSLCFVIYFPAFADVHQDETGSGELRLFDRNGAEHESLLLSTDVNVDVTAMTARVVLRQKFSNPGQQWMNARYVFPLPETAAVHAMTLKTSGRVIRGEIQPRKKAKETFVKAKASGKQAALVESERANLFTLSAANIAPGDTVEVELIYLQTVEFREQAFRLRLPTTLTPRYIAGQPLIDDDDLDKSLAHNAFGWGQDTDQVADGSKITPWQVRQAENSHYITFSATLDTGLNLAQIDSPSHPLDWQRLSDVYQVAFAQPDQKMDRDIVLRWQPVVLEQPDSALFSETIDGQTYLTMMLLPPTSLAAQVLPREVIFVIDSSGSMAGSAMPQAKHSLQLALDRLGHIDSFNIIDFDSEARKLFNQSRPALLSNIQVARGFVSSLVADGGTNIADALDMALTSEQPGERLRQVIFITDGSVGNEHALFKKISDQLGQSRLFTVGIGSAPNSYFMRKAARFGRGTFTMIDPYGDISIQMSTLFSQLEKPALRDIKIDWPAASQVEQFPQHIPDLYAGQPLLVTARLKPGLNRLTVRGQIAGQQWQRTLHSGASISDSGLATIWAQRKIDTLFDSMVSGTDEATIKPQVVQLAVEHHLLTRYTSFVAVDRTPVKPADELAEDGQVPNLMPHGNTMAVPFPPTATSATLTFYLGVLFLLFATSLLLMPGIRRRKLC